MISENDYRGSHIAPSPDEGSPLHNVSHQTYPKDFYEGHSKDYSDGFDFDHESLGVILGAKNKPNKNVKIYRAVPHESNKQINPGDWVTTSKKYAKSHGEGPLNNKFKIIQKTVPAKHLYTNGDSIHEWGYHPNIQEDFSGMGVSGSIAGIGIDNPNLPNQAEPGINRTKNKRKINIIRMLKRTLPDNTHD